MVCSYAQYDTKLYGFYFMINLICLSPTELSKKFCRKKANSKGSDYLFSIDIK